MPGWAECRQCGHGIRLGYPAPQVRPRPFRPVRALRRIGKRRGASALAVSEFLLTLHPLLMPRLPELSL